MQKVKWSDLSDPVETDKVVFKKQFSAQTFYDKFSTGMICTHIIVLNSTSALLGL